MVFVALFFVSYVLFIGVVRVQSFVRVLCVLSPRGVCAVCHCVLQCVAAGCSVLQCVVACFSDLCDLCDLLFISMVCAQRLAVWCSVLECVGG